MPAFLKKIKLTDPRAAHVRDEAEAWLHGQPVIATVKLDGSNIGIDANGTVFSRTQVLDRDQEYFMRAPLANVVRYTDSVKRVQEILGTTTVVYGELLCIETPYPYGGRDLKWFAFGARVTPMNADLPDGVWAVPGDDGYATLPLSPSLQKIFERCGLCVVPVATRGSLMQCVTLLADGMDRISGRVEGYVLHYPSGFVKWKTSKTSISGS